MHSWLAPVPRRQHDLETLHVMEDSMAESIDLPSVRAPEFPTNLDWINTGGRALTLQDFRGKITILDFWV
jgi:hypothetical protein